MNDLEQSVDRVAAETGFSGVVRVDRGDGVELAKAYGLARRGHQVAATVDTQFAIASGGKGLTALAVVSLIEASELDLATTDRSVLGNDLPLIGAGQGQSTTARWTPLLSLAVPCSMPQTCPKAPWAMSHLSAIPIGAHRSKSAHPPQPWLLPHGQPSRPVPSVST